MAQMQGAPPAPDAYDVPSSAAMPTRRLGRTGVTVSLMGLGGFHLGIPSERDAVRIVHEAMDHGVTFLDNCWDYNDGESERRMGMALAGGRRDKAFLMTKLESPDSESMTFRGICAASNVKPWASPVLTIFRWMSGSL